MTQSIAVDTRYTIASIEDGYMCQAFLDNSVLRLQIRNKSRQTLSDSRVHSSIVGNLQNWDGSRSGICIFQEYELLL